jgi:drug/metabolite transporter (DMT)-like permease
VGFRPTIRLLGRMETIRMQVILLIVLTTSFTIISQMVLKHAVNGISDVFRNEGVVAFLVSAVTSPFVWGALILQVGGYVLWFFVLAQERLSVAFAINGSFFYLLMAGASWLVFDERLNPWQWLGLVLISSGVVILNLADKAS